MIFGIGIGWSNVFAIPIALSVDTDEDGDRWVAIHIGPFVIEFMLERP